MCFIARQVFLRVLMALRGHQQLPLFNIMWATWSFTRRLSNPINNADTFSCKIITIEPQGGKKQNTRAFVEARSKLNHQCHWRSLYKKGSVYKCCTVNWLDSGRCFSNKILNKTPKKSKQCAWSSSSLWTSSHPWICLTTQKLGMLYSNLQAYYIFFNISWTNGSQDMG